MADRSAAQITIGGCIPSQEAFWNLLHALAEDGAGEEWSNRSGDEWRESIERAVRTGQPIIATNDQAAGGYFEAIEAWCQEYGLPYHRADDGHYAYSPSNAAYRPDLGDDGAVEVGGTIESGPSFALKMFEVADAEDGNSAGQLLRWYMRRWQAPLPPLTLAEGIDPYAEEPPEALADYLMTRPPEF